MNRNIFLLRSVYCTELLTAAIVVVLFEYELLTPGALAGNESAAYWMELVGVALTLICIPLGLKLMTLRPVREAVHKSEQSYLKWSLFRLEGLAVALFYNVLSYYLLGCQPGCIYMALMIVAAFLFVWPSADKMNYERGLDYSQEES